MNVDDLLSRSPMDQIAGQLGIDPAQPEQLARQAVPALVGGMEANAREGQASGAAEGLAPGGEGGESGGGLGDLLGGLLGGEGGGGLSDMLGGLLGGGTKG